MNEPAMHIEDPKPEDEIDPFLPHAIPYCSVKGSAKNNPPRGKEVAP